MKYVIDSYAWLAYFMGTGAGENAKPIIESSEEKNNSHNMSVRILRYTLKVDGEELAEKQRAFIKEKSSLLRWTN